MKIAMKYGRTKTAVQLPEENILGTIEPNEPDGLTDPRQAVKQALNNPIGTSVLATLATAKQPNKVVIVVNDATRPTPYQYLLPPMLDELHGVGIKPKQIIFLVATGIHRGNTYEENREAFGENIVDKYQFVNHDSTCAADLVNVGKLADGNDLVINRHVAEADLLITTGLINLHYFAGYSGGRKSILPGVVSKELITLNHARMTEPGAETGSYLENPVHHIMMEAARRVGVDFILNVVTNAKKEMVSVVAGDVEDAWLAGVKACEAMNVVTIPAQADVIFASAGGYPKDINIYQAQKAMEHASQGVRPGGTIVLLAQCPEGYGEDVFAKWVEEASCLADIFTRFNQGFELGGHKAFAIARILEEREVILVSDMPRKLVEKLYCRYAASVEEALGYIKEKHGESYDAWIMPEAGMVLPTVESQCE